MLFTGKQEAFGVKTEMESPVHCAQNPFKIVKGHEQSISI